MRKLAEKTKDVGCYTHSLVKALCDGSPPLHLRNVAMKELERTLAFVSADLRKIQNNETI